MAIVAGFTAAEDADQLPEFYDVVACRQVLMVPKNRYDASLGRFERPPNWAPRCVVLMPLPDLPRHLWKRSLYDRNRRDDESDAQISLIVYTTLFVALIGYLVVACIIAWAHLDVSGQIAGRRPVPGPPPAEQLAAAAVAANIAH